MRFLHYLPIQHLKNIYLLMCNCYPYRNIVKNSSWQTKHYYITVQGLLSWRRQFAAWNAWCCCVFKNSLSSSILFSSKRLMFHVLCLLIFLFCSRFISLGIGFFNRGFWCFRESLVGGVFSLIRGIFVFDIFKDFKWLNWHLPVFNFFWVGNVPWKRNLVSLIISNFLKFNLNP